MNLDLGSPVKSNDGKDVGKVDRIFFDTDRMMVRQFVVHRGVLLTDDRIVDRQDIDHVDPDHTVQLKLSADAVHQLQPFVTADHLPVFSGDYHQANQPVIFTRPGSNPTDAVVLTHGSEVFDAGGKKIGHLDVLQYDQDGNVTCFVADAGFFFTHDVKIRPELIKSITHDRIELNISAEEAEKAER